MLSKKVFVFVDSLDFLFLLSRHVIYRKPELCLCDCVCAHVQLCYIRICSKFLVHNVAFSLFFFHWTDSHNIYTYNTKKTPHIHYNYKLKSEKVKLFSRVWLFVIPWTIAYQAPLSMEFSRQECWSGLPFPSPGDLPDLGIKYRSPTLQADILPSEPPGKPVNSKQQWIMEPINRMLCIRMQNEWTCFVAVNFSFNFNVWLQ